MKSLLLLTLVLSGTALAQSELKGHSSDSKFKECSIQKMGGSYKVEFKSASGSALKDLSLEIHEKDFSHKNSLNETTKVKAKVKDGVIHNDSIWIGGLELDSKYQAKSQLSLSSDLSSFHLVAVVKDSYPKTMTEQTDSVLHNYLEGAKVLLGSKVTEKEEFDLTCTDLH